MALTYKLTQAQIDEHEANISKLEGIAQKGNYDNSKLLPIIEALRNDTIITDVKEDKEMLRIRNSSGNKHFSTGIMRHN